MMESFRYLGIKERYPGVEEKRKRLQGPWWFLVRLGGLGKLWYGREKVEESKVTYCFNGMDIKRE